MIENVFLAWIIATIAPATKIALAANGDASSTQLKRHASPVQRTATCATLMANAHTVKMTST